MAAYINSQSSSLAPTDFRLTTSFEEGNGTISVAVEKCQLCTASRRPFYCKDCVRKGDFTHSSGRNSARWERLFCLSLELGSEEGRDSIISDEGPNYLGNYKTHTGLFHDIAYISVEQGFQCWMNTI